MPSTNLVVVGVEGVPGHLYIDILDRLLTLEISFFYPWWAAVIPMNGVLILY